jgi:hypothetical protein
MAGMTRMQGMTPRSRRLVLVGALLALLGVLDGVGDPLLPTFAIGTAHAQATSRSPASSSDSCAQLRALIGKVSAQAAEYPDDMDLQVRAARIVRLERALRVDMTVLAQLRQVLADPKKLPGWNADPDALRRQIAMSEAKAEKTKQQLEAERRDAAAAGYPELAKAETASKVVANAAWRHLQSEAEKNLGLCADPAKQQQVREFFQYAGYMAPEGSAAQDRTIRRLLGE